MKLTTSRIAPWLFAIIALFGSLLWYRHASEIAAPAISIDKPVHTILVAPTDFQPTEEFSGFIHGTNEANISPKTSGYVVAFLKKPGDHVRFGETLALLDGNALIAQKQSADQNLTAAIHSLNESENYYRQKVDESEAALAKVKADRNAGNANNKDVNLAKEAVQSAQRLRDAQIAQAEASVTAARGGTLVAQALTTDRIIRAPFDGVITAQYSGVGSLVHPGAPLYTLTSPDALEIHVSVPARIVRNIHTDLLVDIQIEHSDHVIQGAITSVAQALNPSTGETMVRVRIPKDAGVQPFIGQYAHVRFPSALGHQAILIPESAIIRAYDDTFVFVVINHIATKRLVTLGQANENGQREILTGLQLNEQLITEGLQNLQDRMTVKPYDL
jgi:RND family efflux transporter MFP subunit